MKGLNFLLHVINNKTVDLTVLLVLFVFGLVFVSVSTQSVLAQSSTAAKNTTGTNATGAGQKCPKC